MAQKSIKKNTVFNALKTVSSIIFPLITFPYISRVLLPENVGKINFGLSIVSYFSLIASLGITTYAIKECSEVREDKKKLSDTASQIWSINIITTVVAYVLLSITLIFYQELENYRTLIVIQSLSIVFATINPSYNRVTHYTCRAYYTKDLHVVPDARESVRKTPSRCA